MRDRLRPGQFFGFLPLVHFLQVLTETTPSELQACFIIDDPNLHGLSYGHVSYPTLARHAEKHGYHVAMARSSRRLARFAQGSVALPCPASQLSLLVHGNDHLRHELARARSVAESTAVAAQALRGSSRSSGVPGSGCRAHGASAQRLFDFRRPGHAARRVFPHLRHARSARARVNVALVQWHPAGLRRRGASEDRAPLRSMGRATTAFRAFLGQPLVLYLHHDDLADGLDVLADAARDIETCGAVRWMPSGISPKCSSR